MPTDLRQQIELRGLALPAIRTRGGYFASRSAHDTAWGDLMLAIFTPVGGRFMNRVFGSGLWRILFEPTSPDISTRAEFVIRDASRQVPQIVVREVIVSQRNRNIFLKVSFHLMSDNAIEERLVELDRSAVTRFLGIARIQG